MFTVAPTRGSALQLPLEVRRGTTACLLTLRAGGPCFNCPRGSGRENKGSRFCGSISPIPGPQLGKVWEPEEGWDIRVQLHSPGTRVGLSPLNAVPEVAWGRRWAQTVEQVLLPVYSSHLCTCRPRLSPAPGLHLLLSPAISL